MARSVPVWTWDVGEREIDLDARPEALVPVLEMILEGGLWNQCRKFPPDTLGRLPREINEGELRPLTRSLVAPGVQVEEQQVDRGELCSCSEIPRSSGGSTSHSTPMTRSHAASAGAGWSSSRSST